MKIKLLDLWSWRKLSTSWCHLLPRHGIGPGNPHLKVTCRDGLCCLDSDGLGLFLCGLREARVFFFFIICFFVCVFFWQQHRWSAAIMRFFFPVRESVRFLLQALMHTHLLVQRVTRLVSGRGHASFTCGDGIQAYHLVLHSHSENQVVN